MLVACTVDSSVIDDLPCECADGFVCDVASNRCVPVGQAMPDAGSDDVFNAPDAVDAAAGLDVGAPDASTDVGARDAGPVRDPLLGDCLAGSADIFTRIDSERWGSTTDTVGTQTIEDDVFVAGVPENNRSAYSFLFGRERVDLRECAILVEMPAAEVGEGGVSFFSARITNDEGQLGFGVERDTMHADYHDGTERVPIWSADYDPDEHRWFAFRGDAGELIWLISADGREWTEVGRVPAPIALDALQPLFGVGANRDNATDVEGRFDNYNNPPI